MAKSTYTCPTCGAAETVVARNRAEADRTARWMRDSGRVCQACRQREQAARSAEIAAASQAAGLPALVGSERQIVWAESLRRQMLDEAERLLPAIKLLRSRDYYTSLPRDERQTLSREAETLITDPNPQTEAALRQLAGRALTKAGSADRYELLVAWLRRQDRASWWIEQRGRQADWLAEHLASEIDELAAEGQAKEIEAVSPEQAAAALAEALLKPAGTPISRQIAEISYFASRLRVSFAERNESLRQILRDLGFEWSGSRWERRIDFRAGDPLDRQAEVAHRLLGAGFMVRLHDEEARARALEGRFAEEQQRWIRLVSQGDFSGWCLIEWPREDDFWIPARQLAGSRGVKGHRGWVVVPPTSLLELADFAETYGFSLTRQAQSAIEAHRKALAAGAVVERVRDRPLGLQVDAAIPTLPAEPGEVDPDLIDREDRV